jgi:hypothetical protein
VRQTKAPNLVKGGKHVVGKLDLCDWRVADGRHADGEACDALLDERRVEDALPAFVLVSLRFSLLGFS